LTWGAGVASTRTSAVSSEGSYATAEAARRVLRCKHIYIYRYLYVYVCVYLIHFFTWGAGVASTRTSAVSSEGSCATAEAARRVLRCKHIYIYRYLYVYVCLYYMRFFLPGVRVSRRRGRPQSAAKAVALRQRLPSACEKGRCTR